MTHYSRHRTICKFCRCHCDILWSGFNTVVIVTLQCIWYDIASYEMLTSPTDGWTVDSVLSTADTGTSGCSRIFSAIHLRILSSLSSSFSTSNHKLPHDYYTYILAWGSQNLLLKETNSLFYYSQRRIGGGRGGGGVGGSTQLKNYIQLWPQIF